MRKSIFAALIGGAVALTGATAANAQSISYSTDFLFGSTKVRDVEQQGIDNAVSTNYSSQLINLSGFDTSLGSLLSVDISFDTDYSLKAVVRGFDWYNKPMEPELIEATGTSAIELSVSLTNPLGADDDTLTAVTKSCSGEGTYKAKCSSSSFGDYDWDAAMDLSSIALSAFEDTTLQFNLERLLSAEVDSCGAGTTDYGLDKCVMLNKRNEWAGSLSVTYVYDAVSSVPEPATLAMFGLGLMGIGFAKRKSRK